MKTLVRDLLEEIAPQVDSFPWEQRDAYVDWLAQTYYYVCHSTRLLATAAGRFELDDRGNALHRRFGDHIHEEKKHELLALHDLKVLGASIGECSELPITRMFYEPQYYKIEHVQPVALFGYILALEAIGPRFGPTQASRIIRAFGEKAASFLKLHTEEDVDHLDKAFAMIEATSPRERKVIEDNLRQTLYGYGAILTQIRARLRGAVSRSIGE